MKDSSARRENALRRLRHEGNPFFLADTSGKAKETVGPDKRKVYLIGFASPEEVEGGGGHKCCYFMCFKRF